MHLQLRLVPLLYIICSIQLVRSSHFRGGIIMVRPQPGGVENQMEISYHVSWRTNYNAVSTQCNDEAIENRYLRRFTRGRGVTCWSGCTSIFITNNLSGYMSYYCTDFSVSENWTFGGRVFSHVIFSTTATATNITIGYSGEAWIEPFNGEWRIPTTFSLARRNDTGRINSTPRAITSPVIRLQHGCNHTLRIPVSDPDGDVVRCRWAVEYNECGSICGTFKAAGAILSEESCTFSYVANGTEGFRAVAIMIEDFLPGSSEPFSSVALQFLISVYPSTASCYRLPQFISPTIPGGACVAIPSGSTFSTQIVAHSENASITEFQTTSPSGLRKTDIQLFVTSDSYYINITWTPQQNQMDQTHSFCVTAINAINQASEQRCIQLLSGYFPPVINTVFPNQTLVHPLDTVWTILFNQPIRHPSSSAWIAFFDRFTRQLVHQIDTSISTEITFDNNIISVAPDYQFIEKRTFYVTLDRGVVVGLDGCGAGNEPVSDKLFWTFETLDITPPVISFVARPVRSNENITITWLSNEVVSYACTIKFENENSPINCSQASWSGESLLEGTYQLIVNAIDLAGNVAIVKHNFVVDLTVPIALILQKPTLVSNQPVARFAFDCNKNCTFKCLLRGLQSSQLQNFSACNEQVFVSPQLEQNKTYIFTVIPTDDVGNIGDNVSYTWQTDFVNPQIPVISNVTTFCFETNPDTTGTPTAVDNRPEDILLMYEDTYDGCLIERTWTATDVAGNTDSFVQFISLEFPVSISSASVLAFPCDGASGAFELPLTVYSPNPCQLPLNLSFTDSVSQFTCPGEFTRNWTAQACGQNASTSQLIRFFDSCSPNACGRSDSPPRGICSFGQCSCSRPWFGSNCSRLIYEPELLSPNTTVLEEGKQYLMILTLIRGTPPFFWTLVSAPDGLRLYGNSKQIVWTQAQAGNHTITIQVENEAGVSTATWTLIVRPGYTATIDPVSPSVFHRAQPVLLTGTVKYIDNNLVHGVQAGIVPISIDIISGNSIRVINTFTKTNGSFSTVFYPVSTEFGSYIARARHPNTVPSGSATSWRILGMRAEPSYITLLGEINGLYHAVFYNTTKICGSIGITGIVPNALFLNLNELSVSVSLSQDSISSSSDDCIYVSMEVTASRPLNLIFLVDFTADHGAKTSAIVNVHLIQALPRIKVSPENMSTRIARGSISILEFIVTNLGKSTATNIQPVIPETPVFSFISLGNSESSYGDGQFNLDSGESALLSIQAMVSEDMPLGEISTSFYIVSDEISQQTPVSLTVSSDLLMNLTIVVEDEYTYFASGEPLVSDAIVTIINYQRDIRTSITTKERRGSALFTNIYEDRYEIFVEAPNHRPLRQVMLVTFNNPKHTIFIYRQSVTYRWTVTPVSFTDTYRLTLESDFETHVPVPVVTVSPTDIDLDEFFAGRKAFFVLNITNHGLIRADNIIIDVPIGDSSFEVTVDNTALGNLEALSSVTVVVHISRSVTIEKRALGFTSEVKWAAYLMRIYFSYVCGDVKRQNIPVVLRRKLPLGNYVPGPIVDYITGRNFPSGGGSSTNLLEIPWSKCGPQCTVFSNLGQPDSNPQIGKSAFKFKGFSSGITEGPCDNCVTAVLRCIPKPDFPFSGCIPLVLRYLNGGPLINTENFTSTVADTKKWISCLVGDRWLPKTVKGIESAHELLVAGGCLFEAAKRCLNETYSERSKRQSLPSIMRNHLESMYPILVSINLAAEILGDQVWLSVGDSQWVSQALQPALDDASELGVLISNTELAVILSIEPPSGITTEDVERLVNRFNNTISGWNSGVLEPIDGANMASYSFTESATNEINKYNIKAINKGFTSYLDAYAYSVNDLNQLDSWPDEEQGVCAVVRIRIEQELAITREAFLAKLEIENQEDTNLERMTLEITITDSNTGIFSTNRFVISNETLSGSLVRAGDSWTLMSEESGSVEWLIAPLSEAAPQTDYVYAVGGTLRYTVDNEKITVPLLPTLITVTPDPSLLVHYFWEKNVIGNNPFTDEVEPSVPFTLGVIVKNAGYGVASSLTLSSGQPKIIENEKGLLVDFMIIGASISNGSVTPSLSLTLGDVQPQSTIVVRWFMISSLQGTFKNFSATFENINPLGDPRLSILDELKIHELVRNVRIYDDDGDDGILDFLVNERQNIGTYPDTLYDSKTLTRYNVSRGEVISIQSSLDSLYTLSLTTKANVTGWVYYRYTDTRGLLNQPALTLNTTKHTLSGTVRIPPENSWITVEKLNLSLHLVDFVNSTTEISFTVTLCTSNCTATSIPFTRPTGTPPPATTTEFETETISSSEESNSTLSTISETAVPTSVVSDTRSPETTQSTIPSDSAVIVTLPDYNTDTFNSSAQQRFKKVTAEILNTYCSQDLRQRCQGQQSAKRQSTTQVTPSDITLKDIKDSQNGVTFLMYVLFENGAITIDDLLEAIKEGSKVYTEAEFFEVSFLPYVAQVTEAPDGVTRPSNKVIIIAASAILLAAIIICITAITCGCCIKYHRKHKKSMDLQESPLLEYLNPVGNSE